MNPIHRRCTVAYSDADPKPDMITLSRDDWHAMFNSYSSSIQDIYVTLGFYHVKARKTPLSRSKDDNEGVPAFTFKGVPVVIREDYEDMMRGRSSSRVVLTV